MMRRLNRKRGERALSAVVIVAFSVLISCGDKHLESTVETYRGTYHFEHPANVGASKTDSVIFTLTDKHNYHFDHFSDVGSQVVEICSSSGTVQNFGSNVAVFDPETIDYGNCDTLRIPRGLFAADFISHGDTIWLDRVSNDTTYSIRLRP
ncbi:MAG: hypothetical protein ABIE70_08985 [bacterium]